MMKSCRRPRETGRPNKKERLSTPASKCAAIIRFVPLVIVLIRSAARPKPSPRSIDAIGLHQTGNTRPYPVTADQAVNPPVVKPFTAFFSPSDEGLLPRWPRRALLFVGPVAPFGMGLIVRCFFLPWRLRACLSFSSDFCFPALLLLSGAMHCCRVQNI
jgi:hypothetical protein